MPSITNSSPGSSVGLKSLDWSQRQNEKNKVETETGKAKSVYFMNALLKYEIHTTLHCKHAECFKRLRTGGN